MVGGHHARPAHPIHLVAPGPGPVSGHLGGVDLVGLYPNLADVVAHLYPCLYLFPLGLPSPSLDLLLYLWPCAMRMVCLVLSIEEVAGTNLCMHM